MSFPTSTEFVQACGLAGLQACGPALEPIALGMASISVGIYPTSTSVVCDDIVAPTGLLHYDAVETGGDHARAQPLALGQPQHLRRPDLS